MKRQLQQKKVVITYFFGTIAEKFNHSLCFIINHDSKTILYIHNIKNLFHLPTRNQIQATP